MHMKAFSEQMERDDVERYRKRLLGLAYRILGNLTDSEDAVQDAFLRWHKRPRNAEHIESPEAWLVTVVTRICIDRVRALKRERELYSGPWLPEPIAAHEVSSPEQRTEISEDLSIAFLALLQQLSGEERAAVVLRNVLGYSYVEVSGILDKTQEASRQLVHRGQRNLRHGSVKKRLPLGDKEHIIQTLLSAMEKGDESAILQILAPNVRWVADGGGKVPGIAVRPISGLENVGKLLLSVARRVHGDVSAQRIELAGEQAIAFRHRDALYGVWTIDVADGQIVAFNNIFAPEKLERIGRAL